MSQKCIQIIPRHEPVIEDLIMRPVSKTVFKILNRKYTYQPVELHKQVGELDFEIF